MNAVDRADRARIVSPRFKRNIVARFVVAGFIVLAAVCTAFGDVGIGIGLVVIGGVVALVTLGRRRRRRALDRELWQ